jgi:hypothetical protein
MPQDPAALAHLLGSIPLTTAHLKPGARADRNKVMRVGPAYAQGLRFGVGTEAGWNRFAAFSLSFRSTWVA